MKRGAPLEGKRKSPFYPQDVILLDKKDVPFKRRHYRLPHCSYLLRRTVPESTRKKKLPAGKGTSVGIPPLNDSYPDTGGREIDSASVGEDGDLAELSIELPSLTSQ